MVKNMSTEKYLGHAATTCVTLNKLFNVYEPFALSIKQYHPYVEELNDIAHKKCSI